jgi:hypothetical protein
VKRIKSKGSLLADALCLLLSDAAATRFHWTITAKSKQMGEEFREFRCSSSHAK